MPFGQGAVSSAPAPPPPVSDLTYRPFQDSDVPGILALWEAAGWGTLDEATWRQWFQQTPNGPSIISVALDGDRLLGQMVFTPAVIDTEAGAFRAVRLAAPILHPDLRKGSARSLAHPAVRLFLTGAETAAAEGYDAIYAQPERAWLAFFKWGPIAEAFRTATFGCAALPLDGLEAPSLDVRVSDGFTEAHTDLWDGALDRFDAFAGVRRDAIRLRYRLSQHRVLDVRDGDRLVGYVAVRPEDGLVMDALADTPEALGDVLRAAAGALAASGEAPFPALKAMRTSAWASPLDAAGFQSDDYEFVVVVNPLSPDFAAADPEAWYAVPAD